MEIKVSNILNILNDCSNPSKTLVWFELNYTEFVKEAIELRIENPEVFRGTFNTDLIWELMLDDPEVKNTNEAWTRYSRLINRLWNNHMDLFLNLFEYDAPSYKKEDTTVEWLLEEVYGGRKIQDLETKEITKIMELYDDESYPQILADYILENQFQNWLINFDTKHEFVYENYTTIKCNTFDIKEALKNVVINRKIHNTRILNDFFWVVDWFAPDKNLFGPNYRKEFILEIFQANDNSGVPMWSEEIFQIIKEHYYDIDFEDSFEMVRDLNRDKIKEEVNHIKKMTELNPLYRHD